MIIKRIEKEMADTWKNRVTKIIQINNRLNILMRAFTLMKLIVHSMSLFIAKYPNLKHSFKDGVQMVKNRWAIKEMQLMVVNMKGPVKRIPVNKTETF